VLVHTSYSVATMDAAIHETVARWQADQREREAAYLESLGERLLQEWGVAARSVLLTGQVATALVEYVASAEPDLVVMTTHGRGGLERVWLGSVADALIRHVAAPVLLIRPGEAESSLPAARPLFRHMVVALDGSQLAEHAIQSVQELVDPAAQITLLRVVVPPRRPVSSYPPHAAQIARQLTAERVDEAQDYLAAIAEGLRTRYPRVAFEVLCDYHPASAILAWSREHGGDGIALSTHGRAPVLRLLLGSITDEVVRRGSVPVLVG